MEEKAVPQEKRAVSRAPKQLVIKYSVDADPQLRKWDISTIKDIGEKGVSFTVNGNMDLGLSVYMRIKLPLRPYEWLEVSGKILRSEEFRNIKNRAVPSASLIRVEFLDLRDEQKVLLQEYVSWFLSKYGGEK